MHLLRVLLLMVPKPVSWAKLVMSCFKIITLHQIVSNQSAQSWRPCVRNWKIYSQRNVECCTNSWTCLKGCNLSTSGVTPQLIILENQERIAMKIYFHILDRLITYFQGNFFNYSYLIFFYFDLSWYMTISNQRIIGTFISTFDFGPLKQN